ncbi:Lsr2-like DNA bridging protein [Microbacterium phage Kaijohn]|uniref:Lsr2-like DNA bridging protein n=1 Tax=Microbacterium phage Kaijohn TaxID=2653750 RepID=A0A5Q2WGP5_9CAUD|nr:Lsr2-like DNA bridging protein [Microbacterium phage Kaijohn]QGH78540.1 Lsr2-like DNA bridging protein [Microbacterium phage Kaijohn]
MATRTIELLTDDLDGSEDDVATITFAHDGAAWEIDLNAEHRAELFTALWPYMEAGRPVKRPRRRRSGSR